MANELVDLRTCTRCSYPKPIAEFATQPWGDGYMRMCRVCKDLGYKFGITYADYVRMYQEQNGCCKICNQPETSISSFSTQVKTLAIDHDESTGKIRGLLCQRCNLGIGQFLHDTDRLRMAIKYLEETV